MPLNYQRYDHRKKFRVREMSWLLCDRIPEMHVDASDPQSVRLMKDNLKEWLHERFPERYTPGVKGQSYPKLDEVFYRSAYEEFAQEMVDKGVMPELPKILFPETRGKLAKSKEINLFVKFLVSERKKPGPQPHERDWYLDYGKREFGLGPRQAKDAWNNAAKSEPNPEWSKPGRRKKSVHN